MMVGLVVALLLQQSPPEVRELPLVVERSNALELIAASDRFVWYRVRASNQLSGGAAVFRVDRRDGGVLPFASAVQVANDFALVTAMPARAWTDDTVVFSGGLLTSQRKIEINNARVIGSTDSLLFAIDGLKAHETFVWVRGEPEPRRLARVGRFADVEPLDDGRLAIAGDDGVIVLTPDGGESRLRDSTLAGAVGSMLLLQRTGGVFTEAGLRLGDAIVRPAVAQPRSRVVVRQPDGGLDLADGGASGTHRLVTTSTELDLRAVTVGDALVAFHGRDGGLIVERLGDGARFTNPPGAIGSFFAERGRVRRLDRKLELFLDGGAGPPVEDPPCEWRRLRPSTLEEFCLDAGRLLFRPFEGGPVEVIATDLSRSPADRFWPSNPTSPMARGLIFGTNPGWAWTDGVAVTTSAVRLEQEVGHRFLLGTTGFGLLDPATGATTDLGLIRAARPLLSARELYVQTPACQLLRVEPDARLTEIWKDDCVDAVVETDGGTLFLTRRAHVWLNPKTGLGEAVAMVIRNPPAARPVFDLARFGDTAWASTGAETGVAIDTRTGKRLVDLPTGDVSLNQLGALSLRLAPEPVWLTFDGGFHRFQQVGGELAVSSKVGARAAWVVGQQVEVTTGGPPMTLAGLDAGTWRRAHAVDASLVAVQSDHLVVLSATGEVRRVDVVVPEPERAFPVRGRLVFTGWDEAAGAEPWTFDGTTAARLADLAPGPASSYPTLVGEVPRGLIFQASRADGTIGAVAVLTEPATEQRAFSGGGCSTAATAPLVVALLALLNRPRRSRSRP